MILLCLFTSGLVIFQKKKSRASPAKFDGLRIPSQRTLPRVQPKTVSGIICTFYASHVPPWPRLNTSFIWLLAWVISTIKKPTL